MKIAISVQSKEEGGLFEPRFGRTNYFAIYDTESGAIEFVDNPNAAAVGGAGPKTVQFLLDLGVQAVISGQLGANASMAAKNAGLEVYQAMGGTLQEVINDFKGGNLRKVL